MNGNKSQSRFFKHKVLPTIIAVGVFVATGIYFGFRAGFEQGYQSGQQTVPPEPPGLTESSAFHVYAPNEQYDGVERIMSVSFPHAFDKEERLGRIAKIMSYENFCGLPIEVIGVENNIATVNLLENPLSLSHEDELLRLDSNCGFLRWDTGYFQGSTGGAMTASLLVETFLQPKYVGPWIDGVKFLYEGDPIDSEYGQFQHLGIYGVEARDGIDLNDNRGNNAIDFSVLPDGDYALKGPPSDHLPPDMDYILLIRISGDKLIGYDMCFLAENSCISGFVSGDQISEGIAVCPPYGDRDFSVSRFDSWSLSDYQLLERDLSDWEKSSLQECVNYFDISYPLTDSSLMGD